MSSRPLLSVENVTSGYVDEIDILEGLTLDVKAGTVTGVIGPNGAGKSTLLKTVFGFLRPRSGKMFFDEKEITHRRPHEMKALGISYMLQELNAFPELTVKDNLLLGGWTIRHDRELVTKRLEEVFDFFPALRTHRHRKANYLSGGELRMLALGREIMTKPRLFLIDEPSEGLAPIVVREVYLFLQRVTEQGMTMLLVDQNIMKAVEVSNYMYLLEMGKVKQRGPKGDFVENIRKIIQESIISR